MSAEQYLAQLQALLPPGAAWPRERDANLTQLLAAFAEELARVDLRGDDLTAEADPRTTYELLADFERVFGLPAACAPATQSVTERRSALASKMAALGGQSPRYYFALLERLGYVSSRWTPRAWQFINSAQGWVAINSTLTVGATSVTLAATAAGPGMTRAISAAAGGTYRYVVARFRRLAAGAWEGNAFYTTPAHGVDVGYSKLLLEPAGWSTGEWITSAWDMHDLTNGGTDWRDSSITGLRIDFSYDAGSSVEIDWIALSAVPDPDLAITIDEQVDGLPHRWRVNAPATTVSEFTVNSPCTDPLRAWGNEALECVMNRYKPAHSDLLFGYA